MSLPEPLPLAEAQARLLGLADPLAAENVGIDTAVGRTLAEPLIARRTQPAADLSAMDGYAVRTDDLHGPWVVAGETAAGHPFGGTLSPGEAVRISTGALLPVGAGAVLLQENAAREGDRLRLNGEGVPTPAHIRRAGFDFAAGDELLPAGTRIGPAQLALSIGAGRAQLAVHALPRVAIIDSGDELSTDPAACAAHQIPASNGAMLAAMAAPLAGTVTRIGPVADRLEALVQALEAAGDANVIVTSGGASVGDHDLVRPALERWGADIDFWRVAMKPGKPLLVARKGSTLVLGLPGNPVSGYVTAFLFLLPLLRKLGGTRESLPRARVAALSGTLPAGGPRLELRRAILSGTEVAPLPEQDSSALRALASANALIERPIGAPAAGPGDAVRVYPLQNGGIA
ncbi:molybdopterin molybdotransferase MoeA [Altericroceibacterium xinjiangense]|uniref:molybdopterin molybdotransferase MoeA n=1 Tax=Altericroceibacterium xinjiangense TaxID=762261 RepID=UPI000F7F8568|nr:molybdopterin molybdotransferase MoeA [Altericroceibacterium xinjiangense]